MGAFWDIVMVGLPLALFVALAAAFVMVYRRAVDLAADTRASESTRRSAVDHAARAAGALYDAALQIDAIRRSGGSVAAASAAIAAANPAVAAARDGVSALRPRPWQEATRAALRDELAGAAVPLAAAARACEAMAATPESAEVQTGLKRAYLALLHAREAILDAAGDLSAAQSPVAERRPMSRPRS